jgi:hypothetical protein
MRVARILSFALIAVVVAAAHAPADEPKGGGKAADKLVGTWTLTSAKWGGEAVPLPADTPTLKHITPTHYTWMTYGKDGVITRAAGGTYTLTGDEFTQQCEYGVSEDFTIVKGKNSYKCRVEGDKWHHAGKLPNGLTIEEVWERVKK